MPSSMRWWVLIKSLSRWSLTYGLLLFTRKKGVTLRSALVLPVIWKWFGTGLSAPLSISPACCKVRVPIFDPDWPPYCRGFFLDSRTYRQDFVLQLIWSSIWMTLPELWILTSLITCLGLSVRWTHAAHWLLPVPRLHLDTPRLTSLSPCLVLTGLALGSFALTSICFMLVPLKKIKCLCYFADIFVLQNLKLLSYFIEEEVTSPGTQQSIASMYWPITYNCQYKGPLQTLYDR